MKSTQAKRDKENPDEAARAAAAPLPATALDLDRAAAATSQRALPAQAGTAPQSLPGRLAGLSVRQQVVTLAFWPFLEQTLGFAVGFVDTAISGRLSVSATEAIAVGAYLGWLMTLMFGAVGIGAALTTRFGAA